MNSSCMLSMNSSVRSEKAREVLAGTLLSTEVNDRSSPGDALPTPVSVPTDTRSLSFSVHQLVDLATRWFAASDSQPSLGGLSPSAPPPRLLLDSASLLIASVESLFSSEAQSDSSELLSVGESFPGAQPESLDKSSDPVLASDTFLRPPLLLAVLDAEVLDTPPEDLLVVLPPPLSAFPSFAARLPTGLRLEMRLPKWIMAPGFTLRVGVPMPPRIFVNDHPGKSFGLAGDGARWIFFFSPGGRTGAAAGSPVESGRSLCAFPPSELSVPPPLSIFCRRWSLRSFGEAMARRVGEFWTSTSFVFVIHSVWYHPITAKRQPLFAEIGGRSWRRNCEAHKEETSGANGSARGATGPAGSSKPAKHSTVPMQLSPGCAVDLEGIPPLVFVVRILHELHWLPAVVSPARSEREEAPRRCCGCVVTISPLLSPPRYWDGAVE